MARDLDEWKGFVEQAKTQLSCGASDDRYVLSLYWDIGLGLLG